MPQVVYFLGAGASAPFGIPTMRDMVSRFEKTLADDRDEAGLKLYQSVKNTIVAGFGYADLESVFSVIQGIAENRKVSELGFAASYALARKGAQVESERLAKDEAEQRLAGVLLDKFKKRIREMCYIGDESLGKIDEVYLKFFTSVFPFFGGSTSQSGGRNYPTGDWAIYTTNYDLVIERYTEGVLPLNTLFNDDGRGRFVLNTNKLGEQTGTLKLVKLHGSVDWFRLSDETVVKSRYQPRMVGRHSVEGEEMLYPIQQKDLYLFPWFDMFSALKRDLANAAWWVIIGYGFNDEFITNVFKQAMRTAKHNVIVIHPRAVELVQQKFGDSSKQIVTIVGKFGEEMTNRALEAAMRTIIAGR
jgi:hypothetical protein